VSWSALDPGNDWAAQVLRSMELAAQDDYNGEAVWRRITDAVRELANHTPAGPLH
jgi:hypothetical protein